MSAPTLTLAEFLLARIADDEGDARVDAAHTARWDPRRVLAECAAKRRIVEDLVRCEWIERQGDHTPYAQGELGAYQWATMALAAVYADHADYQPEWRP